MSHLPPHLNPHGAPPPYGHVPQPPFAYVPAAPIVPMMPVYPHQPVDASTHPTYVTNHYYNPPADPVHVVENAPIVHQEEIDWIPANTHNVDALTYKAVVAGKEPGWNSSPLWVIRAHHGGELIPGKLNVQERRAYIPNAGLEIPVHNFQVLCAPVGSVQWKPSSHGQVPIGAISAGNTHSGETLYVGRVNYRRSLTPGKVHPTHGSLYISFAGLEIPHKHYEVLCRV